MVFQKGNIPWSLGGGSKYTEEIRQTLSRAQKERYKKEIIWNKGKHHSEKTREKISKACKGRKAWNKGLKTPQWGGENSGMWKGERAGYVALHSWVRRNLGIANKCEKCGINDLKRYHFANKSGEYKRELDDWIQLCPSCHKLFDNKRIKDKKPYFWSTKEKRWRLMGVFKSEEKQ